ncbi:hypothetical protein CBR_g50078 [Chara braunii]|uniref:Uncharacterized protein n=1 Tax=Chara braunii TaxID=69332 RepID=A0A388M5X4_CHABU|nr:hypothetical protein CBR_g50078 [Chara braunii]|eukprot:GBG89987.1 hypothetical protein CBR_g50078 [Chara braunii]
MATSAKTQPLQEREVEPPGDLNLTDYEAMRRVRKAALTCAFVDDPTAYPQRVNGECTLWINEKVAKAQITYLRAHVILMCFDGPLKDLAPKTKMNWVKEWEATSWSDKGQGGALGAIDSGRQHGGFLLGADGGPEELANLREASGGHYESFFGAVKKEQGKWMIDAEGKESVRFDLHPPLKSQALERFAVAQAYYGRPEVRCVTSETPWCEHCHRHGHLAGATRCLTLAETKEEMTSREERLRSDLGLPEDEHAEIEAWAHYDREFDQIIFAEILMNDSLGDVKEVGNMPFLPRHQAPQPREADTQLSHRSQLVGQSRRAQQEPKMQGRGETPDAVMPDGAGQPQVQEERPRGQEQSGQDKGLMEEHHPACGRGAGGQEDTDRRQRVQKERERVEVGVQETKDQLATGSEQHQPGVEEKVVAETGWRAMEVDTEGEQAGAGQHREGERSRGNASQGHHQQPPPSEGEGRDNQNGRMDDGTLERKGKTAMPLQGGKKGGWLLDCLESLLESEERDLKADAKGGGDTHGQSRQPGPPERGGGQAYSRRDDRGTKEKKESQAKPLCETKKGGWLLECSGSMLEEAPKGATEQIPAKDEELHRNKPGKEPQQGGLGKKRGRARRKTRRMGASDQDVSSSDAEMAICQKPLLDPPREKPPPSVPPLPVSPLLPPVPAPLGELHDGSTSPRAGAARPAGGEKFSEEMSPPQPGTRWTNPLVLSSSTSLSLPPPPHPDPARRRLDEIEQIQVDEMELMEYQRVEEEEENPGPIQQEEENQVFNDIHVRRMLLLDGKFDELRAQGRLRIVPVILRLWDIKLQILLCRPKDDEHTPTIPFLKFARHPSMQQAIVMAEKWLGNDCDVLPMKGVSAIRLLLKSDSEDSLGAYCFLLRAESRKHVAQVADPLFCWNDLEPLTLALPNPEGLPNPEETSTTYKETSSFLKAWRDLAPLELKPPESTDQILQQPLFGNPLIRDSNDEQFPWAGPRGAFGKAWLKVGVARIADLWDLQTKDWQQEAALLKQLDGQTHKKERLHRIKQAISGIWVDALRTMQSFDREWVTLRSEDPVRLLFQITTQALERFSMAQAYYGRPEIRCVTSETLWCENCHKHGHLAEAGRCLTQAETKEEMNYREHRLKNDPGLPEDEHTEIAAWAHFESEYDQIIFAEITMNDNLGDLKEVGNVALVPSQKKVPHLEIRAGAGHVERQSKAGQKSPQPKQAQRREDMPKRALGQAPQPAVERKGVEDRRQEPSPQDEDRSAKPQSWKGEREEPPKEEWAKGLERRHRATIGMVADEAPGAVSRQTAELGDGETYRRRENAKTAGKSDMEIDLRGQEEESGLKQSGVQQQTLDENREVKSKERRAEDPTTPQGLLSGRAKAPGISDMEVDLRGQEEEIGPKQLGVQQLTLGENHEVNGKRLKERRADDLTTVQGLTIGRSNRPGSGDGDKNQQRMAGRRTQGGWCSGSVQEARRSEEDLLRTSEKQMVEKDKEIESLWDASMEEPQFSLVGKKRSRARKKTRVALSGASAQETSASETENLKRQRPLLSTPINQPHTPTATKTPEQQTNVGPEEQADPDPGTAWANPLVLSSSASLSLHPIQPRAQQGLKEIDQLQLDEMELMEFQRVEEEEENPGQIQQAEENRAFNDIHVQRMLVLDGRFDELRQQDRLRIVPLVLRIWEAKLQILLRQAQKETRLPTIPFLKFVGHPSIQKAMAMAEKWLGPDCDVLPMKGVSAIRLLLRPETGESLGAYCFMLRAESQNHVAQAAAPRLEWADLEPLTVDLPNTDETSTTHEETIGILALLNKRLPENKRFTHASFITDPETWLRGPRQGGRQSSHTIRYGNTSLSRLRGKAARL